MDRFRHFGPSYARVARRGALIALTLGLISAWAALQAGPGRLEPLSVQQDSGHLGAYLYVPQRLAERPALVVALHGCGQRVADFDDESGWTALADEAGFILLFPEQNPRNNPTRCFNWFKTRGDRGNPAEAESIRHQVEEVRAAYPIGRERIFITGLSAGGAMTSLMLARYPDLFAGGALIGTVPYGCATNAFQALPCMRFGNRLVQGREAWSAKVHEAAPPGTSQWPRVSIWHDADDQVVNPYNAMSSLAQWTAVHEIDQVPEVDERVGPHHHRVYQDAGGHPQVELWITRRVGHAIPIDEGSGCGHDDPARQTDFVSEAGLCATRHIARFWGLVE